MRIGMFLHRLAPPRPMSPSFSTTIPSTRASRVGRIGLTFYTPKDYRHRCRGGWRFPVVVNFHGGGFTLGTGTDDARWATAVVLEVDAVVVSVDYRLAPEHWFPTAVEDGVDAIVFLTEHADELGLDVQRFAVSGFSAGGNLAFTVPMQLHGKLQRLSSGTASEDGDVDSTRMTNSLEMNLRWPTDFKIVAIVAWYPPTDFTTSTVMRRATCTRPSQAMPNFFVELFDASYIYPPGRDTSHPLLSPVVAADAVLTALPDDIVLFTCEWDVLRAEAERFGARLRRDIGKNVIHTVIPQVAHAWDRSSNPFYVHEGVPRYYKEACVELERLFEKRLLEEY